MCVGNNGKHAQSALQHRLLGLPCQPIVGRAAGTEVRSRRRGARVFKGSCDDEPNRICCSPGCCTIDPVSDAPICMPCFKETERALAMYDLTRDSDSDTEAGSACED